MSKQKKYRPVFGIVYCIIVGALTVLLAVGFIASCNSGEKKEENEEVSYGAYRMSELR